MKALLKVHELATYPGLVATTINTNAIEAAYALRAEVLQFYRCSVWVKIQTFNEGMPSGSYIGFESAIVVLDNTDIQIRRFEGEYIFHHLKMDTFSNLSYEKKKSIRNEFQAPNKMRVLNTKKIEAWVSHMNAIYNKCLETDLQKEAEIQAFLSELQGLPVKWDSPKKRSGSIERGGLYFEFKIIEGYIEKKMKFSASVSIESFMAISDNQYKK